MKDIKKTDSAPPRAANHPAAVSQPALFEESTTQPIDTTATGASRSAGGATAVYARVSSEQQEKEETIASQMAAIEAYAVEHQLHLDRADVYVDDGYSGQILRRPALDKLLDRVYEGVYQQVLVLNPDRLARNYGHQILLMEELQRSGCRALFIQRPIGQGPDEELLLQMQGVIAQYEHAKIQERTRRGKLHRMRAGELVNGQRVFGYQYVKRQGDVPAHYEIIETEAEVLRKLFHWYVHDGLSLRQIAARLREAAVATVRGGRWAGSNVGHMLRNPIYTGTGYANKIEALIPKAQAPWQGYRKNFKTRRRRRPREEWFPFSAPVIIREELFELAQQRVQQNVELAARHTKRPYLLRGLLRCQCCQSGLFIDTQSGSYLCPLCRPTFARERGRALCENKRRLPISQLEELIWREVVSLLKKPSWLKKHYPELRNQIHPRAAGGSVQALDTKLEELQKRINRTNHLFIRGMLDQPTHETTYNELKTKQQLLRTQREKLAAERIDEEEVAELLNSFRSFAATIKSRLDTAEFATRRNIVEQMVKCVSVGKTDITIEYIAPCERNHLRTNLEQ